MAPKKKAVPAKKMPAKKAAPDMPMDNQSMAARMAALRAKRGKK